jgi:DNA polymerase (family 10)
LAAGSTGLYKGRNVVAANEEDIYRALGLPFIEPELREGRGEIGRALEGKLPEPVTDRDLHGILHCHTRFGRDGDPGGDSEGHA